MKEIIESKIQDLKALLGNNERRITELIDRNPHDKIIEKQNKINELKELLPVLKNNKYKAVQDFEEELSEDIKKLDHDVRVLKSNLMTDDHEINSRKQEIEFLRVDILAFEELKKQL